MTLYHKMPSQPRATVRTLATELGVSPITVSRALRGHASVRPGLSAKISRLAAKRGYRSNRLVSDVMAGLGRPQIARYRETVAFVCTHEQGFAQSEERGARDVAASLGYGFETVKPWTQGLDERDVSRILWSRGIRGVLLGPNQSRPDPRYELDWPKFAAVLVGSSLVNHGLVRASRDYYHDAKLAVERLAELGFSRIGMALDASAHERTDRRYAAALFSHAGAPRNRLHLIDPSESLRARRDRFKAWLDATAPDALITDAPEPETWLPRGFPCAHLVLAPDSDKLGVRADFARVGAEAMRLLDGLLRENRVGLLASPVSVLVPGVWSAPSVTRPV